MTGSAKQILVEDEQGRSWMIFGDDTAWPLCELLIKRGLSEVVLLSHTLLTGQLPERLDFNLAMYPEVAIKESPDLKQLVRRLIRLQDCTQFLSEGMCKIT